MSAFTYLATGEAMHIIREQDGGCEGCSLWEPGTEGLLPDLYPLLDFAIRERDPPLHEVFLVRMTDGDLAAVCLHCPWGVRFDMGAGRREVARIAVAHVRAMRSTCEECELGFRDRTIKQRHDVVAHRGWSWPG